MQFIVDWNGAVCKSAGATGNNSVAAGGVSWLAASNSNNNDVVGGGYGRTGGATRQVLWDWQWQHLWPATPEKTCVVSLQSLHTTHPCTSTHTHTSIDQHGHWATDTADLVAERLGVWGPGPAPAASKSPLSGSVPFIREDERATLFYRRREE
jgi:hypothetical protein